jgi:hypothetical protein
MKRFDTKAILDRLIARGEAKEEWSKIIEQGAIGNLFTDIAEGEAEIARYLEYLYAENKWKNARNMTSLTHLGGLIGRKRTRARSAVGYVIVSHTDETFTPRLPNYGTLFFDIDAASDWDDSAISGTAKPGATTSERSALTPWFNAKSYSVPKGSIFSTSGGVPFFSTKTVESKTFKDQYSAIQSDDEKYRNFLLGGGWSGIKYLKIPVMQGVQTTIDLGVSTGAKFESFAIDSSTVEAASNDVSREFFSIQVCPRGISDWTLAETWSEVEDLSLAGPYDKVYETKYSTSAGRVIIKFGNDITGARLRSGSFLRVNYVDTLGAAGNVEDKFQITQMQMPAGVSLVDPRTGMPSNFLQCLNIVPISGGKDIESDVDYRRDAPGSYKKSYATATSAVYDEQINKFSSVNLLRSRVFQSNVVSQTSLGTSGNTYASTYTDGILAEVTSTRKSLLLTGIMANGEKFDDPQTELIEPILLSISDKKSPNDTLQYIEPNYVYIRPNITIGTKSNIADADIASQITTAIMNEYSIFNQDFEETYHKSTVVDLAKSFSFSAYADVFLEAVQEVDLAPIILSTDKADDYSLFSSDNGTNGSLLAFKFSFDKLFSNEKILAGFRNFKQSAPYLIRVDVTSTIAGNKTFLLFDNRTNKVNYSALMSSEALPISSSISVPNTSGQEIDAGGFNITFYDETDQNFSNRQVRTGEFEKLSRILTDSFCSQLKQFNQSPSEIRPYVVDELGQNKIFVSNNIDESLRVPLSPGGTIGSQCFQKNTAYWERTKILFTENYESPTSDDYATGYFVVPMTILLTSDQIDELAEMSTATWDETIKALGRSLQNNGVSIEASAIPLTENFEAINEYDEIFTRNNDVKVEVVRIA